jgi:hypothetical protein
MVGRLRYWTVLLLSLGEFDQLSSHPSIPEEKVKAVISFEKLMMPIVMSRSIEPFQHGMMAPMVGKDFNREMPINVIEQSKKTKSE